MHFRTLRLQGFKKFRDTQLIFKKGLNVFHGPNEVGKTTIHQALLSVLYGLGAKVTGLLHSDIISWNEAPFCRITLEFAKENHLYIIERDFIEKTSHLKTFDHKEGTYHLTNEDPKSIASFITEQTGIQSPDVFKSSVAISQNDLIAASEGLLAVTQNIEHIFTGRDARSPEAILENLNTMRKKLRKSRNEKPGKLDLLEKDLTETRAEIHRLQDMENERLRLEQEVSTAQQKTEKHTRRRQQLENLLEKWYTKQNFTKRSNELKKQITDVEKRLANVEEAEHTLNTAREELDKYEPILIYREKISDFLYMHKRLLEIEPQLEQLMGKKLETDTQPKVSPLVRAKQYGTAILLPIITIDAGIALIALFTGQQLLAGITGAIFFFTLILLITLKLLPSGMSPTGISSFQQLATERAQLKTQLEHIATQWRISNPTDFPKIITKLKMIETLEDKIEKSEIQIKALIGLQTTKKLEKERETLALELVEVKKSLELVEHYDQDIEKVEDWEHEKAALDSEIPTLQEELYQKQGRIQELRKQKVNLQDAEAKRDYLVTEIAHLEQELRAIHLAQDNFTEVIANYNSVYIPKLEEKASQYFYTITNGRYKHLDLAAWPKLSVMLGGNLGLTSPSEIQQQVAEYDIDALIEDDSKKPMPRAVNPNALSQGTLDQLYFALRIGASELLSKNNKLPFLFDDPFIHFDTKRLEQALKIVLRLATDHQILFFTHDERVPHLLERLDMGKEEITLTQLAGGV